MARTLQPTSPSHHGLVADLDHGLAAATLALAGVGAVLLSIGMTAAGTWFGVLGMISGLAAQMMSRTRGERWVDMVGLLAAFLVLAIGASQGGLP